MMKINQRPIKVNAGSMSDIAFLLLIFFIVTTTISQDEGLLTQLPPWPEENQPPTEIKEENVLNIAINQYDEV
jgi:biopolymer transport protein ExbD